MSKALRTLHLLCSSPFQLVTSLDTVAFSSLTPFDIINSVSFTSLLRHLQVCTDRVLMSALEVSCQKFQQGTPLPLVFMRTVIMTIGKHHSLLAYLCNNLLKRLTDGNIWDVPKQWEGWKRAASMLCVIETPSSVRAIAGLPAAQLKEFCTNYSSTRGTIGIVLERQGDYEALDEEKKAILRGS